MDIALEMADMLTPTRINILRMLCKEKHPQDIASSLGISRQGVDKHLSLLYRYGLIDKNVKMERRLMVYYYLTPEGEDFLRGFEDLAQSHVHSVRERYRESVITLDRMLVDGEISEKEYWHTRNEMESRFRWVMNDDKKGEKGGSN